MVTLVPGPNELNIQMVPLLPDIRLENLIIEATYAGAPVRIAVTATNYGNLSGSRTIMCQISLPLGNQGAQTVTLTPGQSKRVNWAPYVEEPGIYYVSVDGLTGSFTISGTVFLVGVGIYDETVPEYIPGTVEFDGVLHTYTQSYYNMNLLSGIHTFNLLVPLCYNFLRWEVYDWDTGIMIGQFSSRSLSYLISKRTFLEAIVQPL